MKRIFLFLSGLAFGVLVGFISFRYPNPIKSELTNASFTEHSLEKVQSIKQLSSKEEQIAAAEAYYGKAVILFLATLAHKNEVNQKDTLEAQTFNKVATAPSDTKPDTGMPTAETIPPVGRLTHKDSLDQKQKNDELIKQERMINFQIAKPFTEFTPQVKAINGLFEGTFTIQSGKNKGRVDFIEFEVDLRQEKKTKWLYSM
ncbi:MAG: hypothetical protein LW878_02900 [Proteobacteria bacterium]|nr:hypothetical protein [Pseudomonadota bacterium]